MICAQCGAAMVQDARFCARCGAPVVIRAAPPEGFGTPVGRAPMGGPAAAYGGGWATGWGRVARQARTLGVLWCCFAGWRLLSGLLALVAFRTFVLGHGRFGGWFFPQGPPMPWMAGLMPVIVGATVMGSALSLLAGWALLTRQSWARVLAIVAAVLSLLKFPLGTALGVYTLVVLARPGARQEWDAVMGDGV